MKRVLLGILVLCTMSTFGCSSFSFRRNILVPELLPKEDEIAAKLEAKYLSYEDSGDTENVSEKKTDGNTEAKKKPESEITKYITELKAAAKDKSLETKKDDFKQSRNEILSNLILLMDIRYHQYERAFYNVGATAGSAFDIAVLGMTAAGAVSGGAETKAILSAIAAGLTGTRLALEKNFLYEQTSPMIM